MTLEVQVRQSLGNFLLEGAFGGDGGVTALFGPSGSGKTSLLRLLAGLMRPQQARVVVDGRVLVDTSTGVFVPMHQRGIGYVFQEPRLFPHLSVRRNLLYGSRTAAAARPRLEAVAQTLGIGHLLSRQPRDLSGGEAQRVALGRALMAAPRLLLLDEPLAAVDEARKAEVMRYLERMRDEMQVPMVYVSHSASEIARLATRVVVLSQGRVVAAGEPAAMLSGLGALQSRPLQEPGSVLLARLQRHDEAHGLSVMDCEGQTLYVPRLDLPLGRRVRLWIPAREVILATQPHTDVSALNLLGGTIETIGAAEGAAHLLQLRLGEQRLMARVTRWSLERLQLRVGQQAYALVKSVSFERY